MKQHGQTWRTADGKETLAKYLPPHEKVFEKNGQKIAAMALDLESQLRAAKQMFIDLCQEALRNNPDQNLTRRLTFHTFDREFKIEYDIKDQYVRVYKATKNNPTSKDYEMIVLDFNRSEVNVGDGPTAESVVSESKSFDGMAEIAEENVYDKNMDGIDQERSSVYTESRPAADQTAQPELAFEAPSKAPANPPRPLNDFPVG